MKITFKDIESLKNEKLEYFKNIFEEESKRKNFLGSLFHKALKNSENLFFSLGFSLVIILILFNFFNFYSLFFTIPYVSFFSYYMLKYKNLFLKIKLDKKVITTNFSKYLCNNKEIDSLNNKINQLTNSDLHLLTKIFSKNYFIQDSHIIIYSLLLDKLYFSKLDDIKENKQIIFNYLKSKNFKNLPTFEQTYFIEIFDQKMNKATSSEKVALLEKKYNSQESKENKLIREI